MTKAKPLPRLSRLQQLCEYCPETGVIRWKVNEGRRRAGAVVGTLNKAGYLICSIDGSFYYNHRIAYALFYGAIDSCLQVDHKNGNKADNTINNLRLCDNAQNNWNKSGANQNKGAHLDKRDGRYSAKISVRGTQIHLGRFGTPEEAHAAYCKAAAELHGEFARAA